MADFSHLSRVLVLEDEALIALDLEFTLRDAGIADIVTATAVDAAVAIIDVQRLDAAVLDLHLGQSGWSYEVARRLQAKGVPFIFSSGTVEIADGFAEIPLVRKPFSTAELLAALDRVAARGAVEATQ